MFGIDFDKYSREELEVAKAIFILLGNALTTDCEKSDVDCAACQYQHLCNDCLAASLNIKATLSRKTRD